MHKHLLRLTATARRPPRFAHSVTRNVLRLASTGAPSAKAVDGIQSLIRDRLNGVSNTLADITAYADWGSIEKEVDGLKVELSV